MNSSQSIAESYAEMALENFTRDGHLAPVVSFFGKESVQVIISEQGSLHMQETCAMIVITCGSCIEPPPTHVVMISEAWSKVAEKVPEDLDMSDPAQMEEFMRREDKNYPRGKLQELADQGDTTVKTVLLVYVFDIADPIDGAYGITINVELDPTGKDRLDAKGADVMGGLPDKIRGACEVMPQARALKPDDYKLKHAIDFIAPLIGAVLAAEELFGPLDAELSEPDE